MGLACFLPRASVGIALNRAMLFCAETVLQGLVLEVRELSKRFGGIEALRNVNFKVAVGELFGIIGPNGAGKTVLLNVVNGVYPPDGGEIRIGSTKVNGMKPNELAKLGVGRTFQVARVFAEMSVFENVLTVLHSIKTDMEYEQKRHLALEALKTTGLTDVKDLKAKALSGGQKKLLEFARLIASGSRIMLLDEPFAGVNPVMINKMVEIIRSWANGGAATLVVSHELGVVSRLCDRVMVLDRGVKIAEGPLREIAMLQEVKRAYLGI